MTQPQLLIVGDSFSAVKDNTSSWTCQLDEYQVDNRSLAGCSEYRILQQIKNADLDQYDLMIVVHTSPNRIYVDQNPLHLNSNTHHACDLIYQDVLAQPTSEFRDHVVWWFENIFDLDHAQDLHNLLIDHMVNLTQGIPTLHVSFFELEHSAIHSLHHLWEKYPGDINHLSTQGNQKVAELIRSKLKEHQ